MTEDEGVGVESLLAALPKGSYHFQGDPHQQIKTIAWDYQKVGDQCLYFCLEDEEFQEGHIDGNSLNHWQDALDAGAVCFVAANGRIETPPKGFGLVEVEDVTTAMAILAKAFHKDPLKNMKVVGITGTNGKTTTTQILDSILLQSDEKTGVIGTIGVFFPSGKRDAGHLSNPLATELFAIGSQMADENVRFLTMEVTSHGLAFKRNHAIDFDIAVFTNLTQDHLDYHKTVESYKKAKLILFQRLGKQQKKAYGIVNIDDGTGKEFIDAIDTQLRNSGKVEVLTYGIRNKDADLVAYPRQMSGTLSEFDVFLRGNHLCKIELPMPGLFNVYNGLAAFGAAFALGISIEKITEGLRNARNVSGRFEKVAVDAEFDVYVDYAHTPDGLKKILEEIAGLTRKRTIVVFGCGGDRDRSKRPQMGQIAAEIADVCIVTSDNPRTENPEQIIRDILAGVPGSSPSQIMVELDRKQAIHMALEMASSEDSVLIAGKGHERTQTIGHIRYPFFDRSVVEKFFQSGSERLTRACLEINLKTLKRNFQLIFQDKPDPLKVMAVVKDEALGHGMVEVAQVAIDAGCDYLGVACLSEALTLRKQFEKAPILVFGERYDNEIPLCIQNNLSIQIQSLAKAQLISQESLVHNMVTRVHLKVDTGMGRYGVAWEDAARVAKSIKEIDGIHLEGIMTHFAQSDEADKGYANAQWQRFQQVLDELGKTKSLPPLIHACNSGGYLDLPHAHGNMVRIGILPCGVYPSKVCRQIDVNDETLQPAMSVRSNVAFVKELKPGDCVGYGMHFTAEDNTLVAILPLGYGDGYPRLRNNGHVLIHGEKAPIIGGNGMDATMVAATHLSDIQVGDEAVLLGKQGDREITAMEIAGWANTTTYEILARWTSRIDRLHVKGQ